MSGGTIVLSLNKLNYNPIHNISISHNNPSRDLAFHSKQDPSTIPKSQSQAIPRQPPSCLHKSCASASPTGPSAHLDHAPVSDSLLGLLVVEAICETWSAETRLERALWPSWVVVETLESKVNAYK